MRKNIFEKLYHKLEHKDCVQKFPILQYRQLGVEIVDVLVVGTWW